MNVGQGQLTEPHKSGVLDVLDVLVVLSFHFIVFVRLLKLPFGKFSGANSNKKSYKRIRNNQITSNKN